MKRMQLFLGIVVLGAAMACADSKEDGNTDSELFGDTASDTATDTRSGDTADSASATESSSDSGIDTASVQDNEFGVLGNQFRLGINGGHRNQSWGDDVQASLEVVAGCNSQRISLPERHLDTWGYEIEVNDMKAYRSLGMHSQVAFLTSPIRSHSTAPADVADWELAYYIPQNLYEPVLLPSGGINPENYWAKYVYDTVKMYSPWIKVWEIWNEPDYTPNWSDTLTWTESAPTAGQLPRFNGSIFEYVRMLRVSMEAARLADPNALIATGGIGYASFLDALLRYTDNPDDGSVTAAYPLTGGAYFQVLSFHHYPIYTSGTSNDGADGLLSHLDELLTVCRDAGKLDVAGIELTETGAPRYALGTYPGGREYARNYVIKAAMKAHAAGVHGMDWFTLSDGAAAGESDDPYKYMGLFEDVVDLAAIDEARITDTGIAYATLQRLLSDARCRTTDTAAPWGENPDVDGVVCSLSDGRHAWVVWAILADSSTQTIAVSLPAGAYDVFEWDYSQTLESAVWDAGGADPLNVGSSPLIVISR